MVLALEDDGKSVRLREADGSDAEAVLAVASTYRPSVGDRVVVAGDADALYVIGVIDAAKPSALAIPGGGEVRVVGNGVELRDAEERLLVRYTAGSAEIAAPAGDLTLAAPGGRVRIKSGLDVAIEAARDITHHAARAIRIGAGADPTVAQVRVDAETASVDARRVHLKGRELALEADRSTLVAREIVTTAVSLKQRVVRFDLIAQNLIERTHETVREAKDQLLLRAGRVRSIVEGAFTQHAQSTSIVSAEDTTIDGERVHLG